MNTGTLCLIIGSMFSGKTTYLLDKIEQLTEYNIPFTVIKPRIDNRYGTNHLVSHDGRLQEAICIDTFNELQDKRLENHIIIDEAQFLPDLYRNVRILVDHGYVLYVAGLNSDYKMNPFGEITNLVQIADTIIHKQSICSYCGAPASFTARIGNDNGEQIEIGGYNTYTPTCRRCHHVGNDL